MEKKELKKVLLNSWELIFLGILSFLTRFFNFGFPPNVVFDETYFGLFATKYFSHQYYLDIHPPLGKLLLALFGFLGKIKPGFSFEVNSPYGDFNFLALRLLPALCGSLFVILVYFLAKELGFSRRVAFLSSFLLLWDNALVLQSRLILLDIILLFFIFLAFYLFFRSKSYFFPSFNWYLLNILCGIFLGAAISVKWTGFGILGIVWFLSIFKDRIFSSFFQKEKLIKFGFLFLLPLVLYFLFYIIHFHLLSSSCFVNCGTALEEDLIFNNQNPPKSGASFFNQLPLGNSIEKFFNINDSTLRMNLSGPGFFYYQSDWFSWPFMIRPVFYFVENQGERTSYLYFFGNPLVWWLGAIGIVGYFYLIIKNYFLKFKLKLPTSFYSLGSYFLIFSYLVYLLPFLAIKRFMLIYHYLPALTFSVILFSIFFEGLLKIGFGSPEDENRIFFKEKRANLIFFCLLFLVFSVFVYFSPFSYGFPLTAKEFQSRIWLDTWAY